MIKIICTSCNKPCEIFPEYAGLITECEDCNRDAEDVADKIIDELEVMRRAF